MKVIPKNETSKFQNGKNCIAFEYPLNDSDVDISVIELTGRYPETRRVLNKVCKEVACVVGGHGKIFIEDNEFNISEGDVVLIMPGERYYWDGNLTMFVSCKPAWTPEQHKETD